MKKSDDQFSPENSVYSVTEILRAARELLESRFPDVRVSGEITGFKVSGPGHMYFSLKDEKNLLNCVFFRSYNEGLAFKPEDGLKVVATGTISLYEVRGQFQLNVRGLEPEGLGALQLQFEQLKKKLAAEGLFDPARKRPLPAFPMRVALVTSPQGAAIRDFHKLLQDKASVEEVKLFPVKVQGSEAPAEIVDAFRLITEDPSWDVVVLTRGGGSLEDLAAFNDESVVRALSSCPVPTISAVGHEIDFTLCDFAADARAATPSQAAVLLGPSRTDIRERLDQAAIRMAAALSSLLRESKQHALQMVKDLGKRSPRHVLDEARQNLDSLTSQLARAFRDWGREQAHRLAILNNSLRKSHPIALFQPARERLRGLARGLSRAVKSRLADVARVLEGAAARLETYHPLSPLKRGYALVTRARDSRVVRTYREAPVGEDIRVRLGEGRLESRVTASRPGGPPDKSWKRGRRKS